MNKKLIAVLLSGLIAGSFMTVSANAEEHTISVTGNALQIQLLFMQQ